MSNEPRLTLQGVARKALEAHPGVSGRELERLARKAGLTISYTTINHMAAGTYKSRPSRKTLDALARLSGIASKQVYEAAERPYPGPPFADELPPDVDRLGPAERHAVITVIRTFLAAGEADRANESLSWEERRRLMEAVHPGLADGALGPEEHADEEEPEDDGYLAAAAARDIGQPSAGQKRRREAEAAGEPATDDPDDMEPR